MNRPPPLAKRELWPSDEELASHGTTREEIVAKYGGLPGWTLAQMLRAARQAVEERRPEPDDGLTPQQRLLAQLRGPAPRRRPG